MEADESLPLIGQFLRAIEPYSCREAAALTGLGFATISNLRREAHIGSVYTQRVIERFLSGATPQKQDRMRVLIERIESLEAKVSELGKRKERCVCGALSE